MPRTTEQTIEYALPMLTGVYANGTTYNDTADTTIFIPETTDRTFLSVYLEVVVADTTATPSPNISAWGVRGSCNGGTNWTEVTLTNTITQSGENMGVMVVADMTAEFTARFGTGASGTFRWGFYMNYSAAATYTNVSAKLIITYGFDGSAHNTRIKTVRIPIECFNGRLSNTAAAVRQTNTAANQIPALDTWLPESSKVYRQIFFDLWANLTPSGTIDTALALRIDSGGTETTFGTLESGNGSHVQGRWLYNVTGSMTTNAAHELFARHTAASGSYYQFLGGFLVVTYEYDAANSTTVMNSVLIPLGVDALYPRNVAGDLSRYEAEFWIEEPSTITLQQSAVMARFFTNTTSGNLLFAAGTQTNYTTYTTNAAASATAGMHMITQRLDSGAHNGSGLTIARGRNTARCSFYTSAVGITAGVSAVLCLNYTSGRATGAQALDAHNKTVLWLLFGSNVAAGNERLVTPTAPSIQPTNYWLNACAPIVYMNAISGSNMGVAVAVERQAGEASGAGWETLLALTTNLPNERMFGLTIGGTQPAWRRWPQEPNAANLLDVEASRQWYCYCTLAAQWAVALLLTYHSRTYTSSFTLANYTGDGSSIVIEVFSKTLQRKIGQTTTSAGGTASFSWYDDTSDDLFAAARQSATRMGRADDFTAGT